MEPKDHQLMYDIEDFYWYWLGKKDMIKKLFNTFVNKKEQPEILDAGCGTGSILESLKGKGQLHGVDMSDYALKLCSKRGNFKLKVMDAQNLSFPKNSFDVIILSDIIEHVDNDKKVVEKCYEILRKNGTVIITVPAHQYLWNQDDVRLHHKRRYSKKMLKSLKGRFKIKKLSYIHFFPYPLALLARLKEKLIPSNKSTELQIKNCLEKGKFFSVLANKTLLTLNKIENTLLQRISFPIGVGLMMVLEKR